jgi:hypothetical protein
LRAIIDATPGEHLTFLVTRTGKPYAGDNFTRSLPWDRRVDRTIGDDLQLVRDAVPRPYRPGELGIAEIIEGIAESAPFGVELLQPFPFIGGQWPRLLAVAQRGNAVALDLVHLISDRCPALQDRCNPGGCFG